MRRYLMLSHNAIAGTMFHREADDWVGHLIPADGVLSMPEIGMELPFAGLYDDLD